MAFGSPAPTAFAWDSVPDITPLGLKLRAAGITPKVPVEPNAQMLSNPFPSRFPPCSWCHLPSEVLTMPFLTCLFLLSFSSPSHRPLVPPSSFLPLFISLFSLFLPSAHISWGPVLCLYCLLRTQQYPGQTQCLPSLQSRKQIMTIYVMSVMGVSKEPVARNGAQSLSLSPLLYSTDFLIISVFPQDICMYLFPQDTIISSQSWHVQATPHPQPDQYFASALSMTCRLASGFHILIPFPALLPGESVLSSQPPARLQDSPGWLPPGLWYTTPSFHRSFFLTPGNPCSWWRSTQQPNLEFFALFCSQKHIFLLSYTHNQTLSSPATALPLVSPHILAHNNLWWCRLCMVIHSSCWNGFESRGEEI